MLPGAVGVERSSPPRAKRQPTTDPYDLYNMDDLHAAAGGQGVVLRHQSAIYDQLLATARVRFSFGGAGPVRLRTSTLIVAPSGTGKTHLAAAVAAGMGVPYLYSCVGGWMVMGSSSRGGSQTLPQICAFLRSCRDGEGAVILLDEIDKLGEITTGAVASSAWYSSVKLEVFQLLDGKLPGSLEGGDSELTPYQIAEATKVLNTKTLILAAGAFEDLWDKQNRSVVGFGTADSGNVVVPSQKELTARLGRELCQRFRSKILFMPPLAPDDYRHMIEQLSPGIAPALRRTFIRLGEERIPEACRLMQGTRFVEELLLDTILAERAELTNWKADDHEIRQATMDE